MPENEGGNSATTVVNKSSWSEKLRNLWSGKRNTTPDTGTLPEIAESAPEGLILLEDKIGASSEFQDFFRMAQTGFSFKSLPLTLKQPFMLTDHLLDLKEYAQANDNEQTSGVYHDPKSGNWYYLAEPTPGTYNYIDRYYSAGPLPDIAGLDVPIDIHSHPSHAREKARVGDGYEEMKLKVNMQSHDDLGTFLHRANRGISIVVGKELAVALCRTKQTPVQKPVHESDYWAGVESVNALIKMEKEIKEDHPDLKEFEVRFFTIAKYCHKNKMGCYMLRLRDFFTTKNVWTRMYPFSENTEARIAHLLGRDKAGM